MTTRIAITAAAYAAIRDSLPQTNTVDNLAALSRPSESISDVIIRLAARERGLP
jgi:hypothetical protein